MAKRFATDSGSAIVDKALQLPPGPDDHQPTAG